MQAFARGAGEPSDPTACNAGRPSAESPPAFRIARRESPSQIRGERSKMVSTAGDSTQECRCIFARRQTMDKRTRRSRLLDHETVLPLQMVASDDIRHSAHLEDRRLALPSVRRSIKKLITARRQVMTCRRAQAIAIDLLLGPGFLLR